MELWKSRLDLKNQEKYLLELLEKLSDLQKNTLCESATEKFNNI